MEKNNNGIWIVLLFILMLFAIFWAVTFIVNYSPTINEEQYAIFELDDDLSFHNWQNTIDLIPGVAGDRIPLIIREGERNG